MTLNYSPAIKIRLLVQHMFGLEKYPLPNEKSRSVLLISNVSGFKPLPERYRTLIVFDINIKSEQEKICNLKNKERIGSVDVRICN